MSGVEIRVRSNTQPARQDLAKLEKSMGNIDKTVSGVTKSLGRLAAGLAAAFTAQQFTKSVNRMTDSLTGLENRIALVTGRTEELGTTLNALYDIAYRSRGAVDGAAETFNRFGRALQGTGASTSDLLKATEAVQKSITISGGSAESARAAIFQLGQGLASGQLRGQELNSVLEQAPRLAQAIADSMGQPIGALRALAEEGKITTDVVFKGLLSQADAINKEFGDLEGTTEQAFTVFGDALGRVTGEISKTLGFSYLFTDNLDSMTRYLQSNTVRLNSMAFILKGDLITGFRDFTLVAGGALNVLGAYLGRLMNAIGIIIVPMRTIGDKIKAGLLSPLLELRQEYRKFASKLSSDFESQMDTGLRGTMRKVFVAQGPEELRAALDELADAIDSYGRRWWNFGNRLEDAFRPAMNTIESSLVGLGILDQSLLRYRAASFEDLNFVLELTNLIIGDLINSLKTLQIWNDFVMAGYVASQSLKRIMDGITSDVERMTTKSRRYFNNMFENASDLAEKYLGKAWKTINNYLKLIEDKFFWVYDRVIGNSWWTDTMEETAGLAEYWLGKAKDTVSNFGNSIESIYKKIASKTSNFREALKDILPSGKNITEVKVEISSSSIKGTFDRMVKGAYNFGKALSSAAGQFVSDLYKKLNDIIPGIGSYLAFAVTTAVASAFAPKTFGPLLKLEFIGLGALIANEAASVFGPALLSSGFLEDLGKGMGKAAGNFAAAIIDNIPKIVQGFVQIVKGFGRGIAEQLGGIPGFLLRLINNIPFFGGDGLIVGLFFGAAGLSIVSKGFRSLAFGVIEPMLQGIINKFNVGSGGGLLSNVVFGKTGKPQAVLTRMAFFAAGATALFSTFPDTLGQGIAQLGFAYLTMFGFRGPAAIIQDLQSVASAATGMLSKLGTAGIGAQIGTAAASIFLKIRSMISLTTTAGVVGSAKMATAYIASFAKIGTAASGAFSKMLRGKAAVLGISAAAIFALTGTADAATEGMSSVESFVSKYGDVGLLALTILGPMMGGPLIKSVTTIIKKVTTGLLGLAATSASVGTRLGGSLLTGIMTGIKGLATRIVTMVGAAFAGIFSMTGALITGAIAAVGAIGIYLFGEGDSFGEKLRNTWDSVRKFFGYTTMAVSDARKELNDLLDMDKVGDIQIDLSARLANVDLSSISDEDMNRLLRVSREANRIFEEAQGVYEAEGELSREETRRVKRAVDLVRRELSDAPTLDQSQREVNINDSVGQILNSLKFIGSRGIQGVTNFNTLTDQEQADLNAAQALFESGNMADALETVLTSSLRPMLEESEQGRQTVALLGSLMSVLQGEALTRISPEEFNAIAEGLSDFGGLLSQFGRGVGFNEVTAGTQAFGDGAMRGGLIRDLQVALLDASQENARQIFLEQRRAKLSSAEDILEKVADFGVDLDPEELARRFTNAQLDEFIQASQRLIDANAVFDELGSRVTEDQLQALNHRTDMYFNALNTIIESVMPEDTTEEVQTRLESLQAQLDRVGVSGSLAFDPMVSQIEAANEEALYLGGEYERMQFRIKAISRLQTQLREDESLTAAQRRQMTVEIGLQQQSLERMIELNNLAYRIEADRVGLIEDALSIVDDAVPLERALALDSNTITKIVAASAAVAQLNIQLANIAAAGSGVDVGIRRRLENDLRQAQDYLNGVLGGFSDDKDKGGKTQTFMEKLTEGLSSAGFNLSVQEAGRLSQSMIDQLTVSVTAYTAAQKRLNESAQAEGNVRREALRELDAQRNRIAEILSSGTIMGVEKTLEAMGAQIDIASLIGLDPERFAGVLSNAIRIDELRQQLLRTNATEIEQLKVINTELRLRQALQEGITTGAADSAEAIKTSIADNLGQVIRGAQSFSDAVNGVLDTMTNRIIDTVLNSFVDAMFQASGMQDMFTNFFAGLFSSGQSMGQKLGKTVGASITESLEGSMTGGSWMSNIMGSVGGLFKNIFGFLGGMGGGGGLFSSIFGMSFGSFLGFSNGGVVPMIAGAKHGVDSVPAMLTPGEIVLNKDQVKALGGAKGGNQTVVNLNVTGDVSRQTRKEIVNMLPQITQGVNANNKENNYRGR